MIFRKTLCILLAFFVISGSAALNVNAAENSGVYTIESEEIDYHLALIKWNYKGAEGNLAEHTDIRALRNKLIAGISQAQVMIELTEFSIPEDLHHDLSTYIFYCLPEAFSVNKIGYSTDGSVLLNIGLGYRELADTPAEYEKCYSDMKKIADRMLDGIENNPSLSEAEKALLLHDRLCVATEYEYYNPREEAHTAYGALVNGAAVCQGYTMAYMYLLNRVGIKNYYCATDQKNHAWNVVYVDGVPYHVDTTWDDAAWAEGERGVQGYVAHENFLRSTAGMLETEHNATDFDRTPTDTKYDNYYWQNSKTEFQLVGNKLYYIDNENQQLVCADTQTVLAEIPSVWYAPGGGLWVGSFARLSSAGGELLYSLADGIYKYTISSGENKKIYTPSMASGLAVFGFTYSDGYIKFDVNNEPPYGRIGKLYSDKVKYSDISHILYKLSADASQAKVNYYIGEKFDKNKISVYACFSDGETEDVSGDVVFSGFSSDSAGKKTIVAEYKGFRVSFSVKVNTPSVTLSKKEITLREDEELVLTADVKPSGQKLSWKSDSSAVSVSGGKITGLKKGTATVTAQFTYCGKAYSAKVKVTVLCAHKKTELHPEIPPTMTSTGYSEGTYCPDCKVYISGHAEIPAIENAFTDGEFIKADEKGIRMIPGVLARELLWQSPFGKLSYADGTPVDGAQFVCTGMVLALPDGTRLEIAVLGDVDADGNITAADARLALRASVGLEKYNEKSACFRAADVSREDALSAADARLILRASVGLDFVGDLI